MEMWYAYIIKSYLAVKENEICRKVDRSAGYYVRQGGLDSERQNLMLSLIRRP